MPRIANAPDGKRLQSLLANFFGLTGEPKAAKVAKEAKVAKDAKKGKKGKEGKEGNEVKEETWKRFFGLVWLPLGFPWPALASPGFRRLLRDYAFFQNLAQ